MDRFRQDRSTLALVLISAKKPDEQCTARMQRMLGMCNRIRESHISHHSILGVYQKFSQTKCHRHRQLRRFVAHGDLSPLPFSFDVIHVYIYIYMLKNMESIDETKNADVRNLHGKKGKIFGDGAATSLRRASRTQQKRRQAVHNLSNATVRKRRGRLWPVLLKGVMLRPQLATHLGFLIQESNVGSRLFEMRNGTSSWNSQMISNRFQYFQISRFGIHFQYIWHDRTID